jgi:cytochrome bd-type quinol oxidase subunit 1
MEANTLDRIQFAFTLTYHYLFPQLTMGLAPLIVIFKSLAIWKKDERWNETARFWGKILGITFLFGVVTGIPMEFQFGTNWAAFSKFAGGVIGQTLAMEGCVRLLSRIVVHSASFFRRKATWSKTPSAVGGHAVPRDMVVRLVHHCDKRVDAASGRIRDRRRRIGSPHKFLGPRFQ